MASKEHRDILQQGKDAWNAWRDKHKDISPDLSGAKLSRATLGGTYFDTEILNSDNKEALLVISYNFSDTNFSNTYLRNSDLSSATLIRANLSNAKLAMAQLDNTNLHGASLRGAELRYADLMDADLTEADLTGADLTGADLTDVDLAGADLTGADVNDTFFNGLDLRQVKGLEMIQHKGPSFISTSTLERSQGDIPEIFLRGAGLSDTFIEYARSLVLSPIQFYSCFISYSSKDQDFAERIYTDLQAKGVRCWFAPHHMKTGDPIRERIDESIRLHDKLLLILSQNSVRSSWVETEVEKAFDKERKQKKKNVLFPIRVDDSVTRSRKVWATDIQKTRHITDFTNWKQHDDYQKALKKLLDDLQAGE